MSTEKNKATLRRFLEDGWNKGDLAVIAEVSSPEIYLHMMPPGTPPGIEPLKQLIVWLRTAFPDLHINIEDQVAEGDKVVVRLTMSGTHLGPYLTDWKTPLPPTGKRFIMPGLDVWRFDEAGKLVECWSTYDKLAQLQQLGAIPAADPNMSEPTAAMHR